MNLNPTRQSSMTKAIFNWLKVACVSSGLLLCANAQAAFLMQSLAGDRVDLHKYIGHGQWTLVMLWTTDCVPCEEQKPMIQSFHDEHSGKRAQVIGLALDGPAKQSEIEELIAQHQPTYTNLVAFDDVFARQFQEETGKPYSVTPTYLFYKPDGSLLGVHAGKISREALDAVVVQ